MDHRQPGSKRLLDTRRRFRESRELYDIVAVCRSSDANPQDVSWRPARTRLRPTCLRAEADSRESLVRGYYTR